MHRTLLSAALFAAIAFSVGSAQAASFTYHGNLQDAGKPADGSYDIELTLYSSPEGGKVVAGPLIMYKVPVHEGTFSTEANFGQLTNVSGQSWLSVAVRNAGKGDFAALSARAPISAAETATNSSCPGSWSLDGNAGNPAGDYLGTADSQPLIIKVGNSQVANALLSSGGTVASWIGGGSLNSTTGSSGSFIGGGGSSANSALANSAGSYCVVGGGTGNQAGGGINNYATVAGGNANSASGYGAAIGGGGGNTASDNYATVPGGNHNVASAIGSFAAGIYAQALHASSFVWADNTATSANPFASTGANQFLLKASGGAAINGAPKNAGVELSVYPGSGNGGGNYSNIFMGSNGNKGGILLSSGDATTAISNDAGFYIDQYNGTAQDRRFVVSDNGVTVNDPAELAGFIRPSDVALAVAHNGLDSVNASSNTGIALYPAATDHNFFELQATADGTFNLTQISDSFEGIRLTISKTGNFTVTSNAYKPGGGTWSSTSDRRIKQHIAPISDAIDTVLKLRPVSFHYTPEYRAMENNLPDKLYLGFVAQEFAEVFPEAVTSTDKHVPGAPEGDPNILALDSTPALITTVAAVQELAVQAQDRDDEVAKLQVENAKLRGKLDSTQNKLDEVIARLSKLESKQGE